MKQLFIISLIFLPCLAFSQGARSEKLVLGSPHAFSTPGPDTIAVNFTSTTTSEHLLYGGWNNVSGPNLTNLAKANLTYKGRGTASTISLDSVYKNSVTTVTGDCTDSLLAPPKVLKYFINSEGLRYGVQGSNLYLSGLNPAKTYTYVHMVASSGTLQRTITIGGVSVTGGTFTAGCNNSITVTGFATPADGRLIVNVKHGTAGNTTAYTGFYLIEQ